MSKNIGRNDMCPCGSGKKYKKCCLTKKVDYVSKWEKNLNTLLLDYKSKDEMKIYILKLIEMIDRLKWEGSCHATSSIMYVLLSELGMKPTLCMGETKYNLYYFDHSWIEVDGLVIDLAIMIGLNGVQLSYPIVLGKSIDNMMKTEGEYGIPTGTGLDQVAEQILKTDLVKYMDSYKGAKNGLWDIVIDIAKAANIQLDINNLREKYKLVNWTLKN